MKGIFRPIDYRTHEQDISHIHYGKAITILEKDRFGYWFSIDDFPNCNHREKQNRFYASHEEIEFIDHPTKKGGVEE